MTWLDKTVLNLAGLLWRARHRAAAGPRRLCFNCFSRLWGRRLDLS